MMTMLMMVVAFVAGSVTGPKVKVMFDAMIAKLKAKAEAKIK